MMTKVLILCVSLHAVVASLTYEQRKEGKGGGWRRIRDYDPERSRECEAENARRQACLYTVDVAKTTVNDAKGTFDAAAFVYDAAMQAYNAAKANKDKNAIDAAEKDLANAIVDFHQAMIAYHQAVLNYETMSQCPAACRNRRSASFMEQHEAKQFI